jgi:hypothetical protein
MIIWGLVPDELRDEINEWVEFNREQFEMTGCFVKGRWIPSRWDEVAEKGRFLGEKLRKILQDKEDSDDLQLDDTDDDDCYCVTVDLRQPKVLKLMNEYKVKFPLWYGRGCDRKVGPLKSDCRLTTEVISPQLRTRLIQWADVFNTYFHCNQGWNINKINTTTTTTVPSTCPPVIRKYHEEEGRRLEEALNDELENNDTEARWFVYLDFWEH